MGRWPTPGNENPRRPRESGDPCHVDSRLRGNDERGLIFRREEPDDTVNSGHKSLAEN